MGKKDIIILILVISLIVVLGGSVVFAYKNFQNQKRLLDARKRIETLERENQSLKEDIKTLKKEEIETKNSEQIPIENKEQKETCPSTLTNSDKEEIKLWKTYKNTVRKYTFKYPETWQVYKNEGDLVGFEDKEGDTYIYFHIISGNQAKATKVPPYKEVNKKAIKVACQDAQRVYLISGKDVIIRTTFEKDNIPYIVMIAYTDIGASLSSDIVEAYDLILKTIEFE